MNKNLTIMLASGAIILLGLFFYWLQGGSTVDSVTEFPSETTPEATPTIPAPTDQPAIEEPVANLPVTPSPLEPIVASEACYVGGCSGQVCSGEEDVITNCLYQEFYACYQQATCERQTTGACGWTQSPTLVACIAATVEDGSLEETR
jgi:eight-cysteine-cluster-containing protein